MDVPRASGALTIGHLLKQPRDVTVNMQIPFVRVV